MDANQGAFSEEIHDALTGHTNSGDVGGNMAGTFL
jgi:hypothetical protein